MIKPGTKIEFESGMQYKIIAAYPGDYYDLKAIVPQFWFMPNYYPVYNLVKIEKFKII